MQSAIGAIVFQELVMSVLLVTAFLAAVQQTAPPPCATVNLGSLACLETDRGLVIAESDTEAHRIAAFATAGERRFQHHFDRSPAPYLVLWGAGEQGLRIADATSGLVVFVFNSPAQRVAMVETASRAAIERQLGEVPAAQRAAAVDAALAQMPRPTLDSEEARDAGTVPHELGHLWFHAAFWPETDKASPDFYVTPAPDWLDEAAAMQMEGDAGPRFDRLAAFAAIRSGVWDLSTLLAKEHPGQKLKRIVSQGSAPADGWSMEELSALGIDAEAIPIFYAQSAAFAEFLVQKTGDPAILARIAEWISSTGDFQGWLGARGRPLGLGSTVPELEDVWNEWLRQRGGG